MELIIFVPVICITLAMAIFAARVLLTTPGKDLLLVKKYFQTLKEDVGPNAQVLSVRKIGAHVGGRWVPSYRTYEVVLKMAQGETRCRVANVEARLFDEPRIIETFAIPYPRRKKA